MELAASKYHPNATLFCFARSKRKVNKAITQLTHYTTYTTFFKCPRLKRVKTKPKKHNHEHTDDEYTTHHTRYCTIHFT